MLVSPRAMAKVKCNGRVAALPGPAPQQSCTQLLRPAQQQHEQAQGIAHLAQSGE